MIFEAALQRLFDDLVVAMILALIPKSARPCVAILELGERPDPRDPVRDRNGIGN